MAIETLTLSATGTSSSVTFANQKRKVAITNDGSFRAHINFDGTATGNHLPIDPDDGEIVFQIKTTSLHAIAPLGNTTLNIRGSDL